MKETLNLVKPLLVDGKELTKLTYDIELINISRLAAAEKCKAKLVTDTITTSVAQMDYPLQICLGIQAILAVNSNIAEEDLLRISGYDITQVAQIGTRFFVKPASDVQVKSEEQQEVIQTTTDAQ